MSDSWIDWKPRTDEPSNARPSSNTLSSNAEAGIEKCWTTPGRSQKRMSTYSTFSSWICLMMSSAGFSSRGMLLLRVVRHQGLYHPLTDAMKLMLRVGQTDVAPTLRNRFIPMLSTCPARSRPGSPVRNPPVHHGRPGTPAQRWGYQNRDRDLWPGRDAGSRHCSWTG